ncbi:MAG TPA: PIN domain-containing protein [Bryobacteraceae bacterium]|nr:PIN domain-containing protein [Bryobacteraceae bacterium]
MTYLDTHVVAWLYGGESDKLSKAANRGIQGDVLSISPIVVLELQFLYDIGRAKDPASKVVEALSRDIGLTVCELPFTAVVEQALYETWVRDPFDRLIVSHAAANEAPLITRDEKIRRYYKRAIW